MLRIKSTCFVIIIALLSVIDIKAGTTNLVVMEFHNNSGDNTLEHLKKGLRDMITTDLLQIKGIRMLERARVEEIIMEHKFSHSEYVDKDTACAIGKLLGASHILTGSYIISNNNLRLDIKFISIESGEILLSEKIIGPKEDIFDLENRLVNEVAGKIQNNSKIYKISSRVAEKSTSYLLFDTYSRALSFQEQKNYDKSRDLLKQIDEINSKTFDIKQKLQEIENLITERKEEAQSLEDTKYSFIISRFQELEQRIEKKDYTPEYFASKLLYALYLDCIDFGTEYEYRLNGQPENMKKMQEDAYIEQKKRYNKVKNELLSFINEFMEKIKYKNAKKMMIKINTIVFNELDKISFIAQHSYNSYYLKWNATQADRSFLAKENRFLLPAITSVFFPGKNSFIYGRSNNNSPLKIMINTNEEISKEDFIFLYSDPINYLSRLIPSSYFEIPAGRFFTIAIDPPFLNDAKGFFEMIEHYIVYANKAKITSKEQINYIYSIIISYVNTIELVGYIPQQEIKDVMIYLNHLSELSLDNNIRNEIDLFISKIIRYMKNQDNKVGVFCDGQKVNAEDYICIFSKNFIDAYQKRESKFSQMNSSQILQREAVEEFLLNCLNNRMSVYFLNIKQKTIDEGGGFHPILEKIHLISDKEILNNQNFVSLTRRNIRIILFTLESHHIKSNVLSEIQKKYINSNNIIFDSKIMMEDYASSKSCAVIFIDYIDNNVKISQIDMKNKKTETDQN